MVRFMVVGEIYYHKNVIVTFFVEALKPSKAASSVKYDFQPLKYPYREDEQINLYLRLKRYLNCVKERLLLIFS